jgi:hypothetical protein
VIGVNLGEYARIGTFVQNADLVQGATGLAETIFIYLVKYISDVWRLVISPKKFMWEKISHSTDGREVALYLVTTAIIFGVINSKIPTWIIPGPASISIVHDIAVSIALWIVSCAVLALLVQASFLLVIARVPLVKLYTLGVYFAIGGSFVFGFWLFIAIGYLRNAAKAEFDLLTNIPEMSDTDKVELYGSNVAFLVYGIIMMIGLMALLIWSISGWGVISRLCGVGRLRSALAFIVCLFGYVIISFLLNWLSFGIGS